MAVEESEAPRLYSKPVRAPVDVVAEQHKEWHVELEAWGRWNREKSQPGTCESVEGQWDPGEGGRESKPPLVTLPENPRHRQIDRVVRHMRMHMPVHGEALVLYYVGNKPPAPRLCKTCRKANSSKASECRFCGGELERPAARDVYVRCPPRIICRILHLHWSAFGPLMDAARAAALNLLRRQGD